LAEDASAGIVRVVEASMETACFRGDDDPRLVSAALACRGCLSGNVEWALDLGTWEAQVECTCRDCGYRRLIGLNFQQALRLSLHRAQRLAM
jgi:hypothetical protein